MVFRGEVTETPFYSPVSLPGDVTVTLYPAGHILGSAMNYIQTPEGSVLYTGDYRNPASPCTEGFDCPAQVDYFITEATFSLPIYRWKSHEELFDRLRTTAIQARERGEVPVFSDVQSG